MSKQNDNKSKKPAILSLYVDTQSRFRKVFSTAVLATILPFLASGAFSTYKYTQSDEYKLQQAFNKAVATDVDNQRPLTENEINFLYNFGFKDSIDYGSVRVYASPEVDTFFSSTGIGGVADNNKVAVSTHSYSDDFFANNASEMGKLLFLHEMTHIWQQQNCVPNRGTSWVGRMILNFRIHVLRHDIDPDILAGKMDRYSYDLSFGQDFSDFNEEAQAQIMEDFYAFSTKGYTSIFMMDSQGVDNQTIQMRYDTTLANFHKDPHYAKQKICLPNF